MTLTIQVRPEKQALLAEQARRAGLTAEQYVERLVDQTTPTYDDALTPQQRAERFVAWAQSQNRDVPALPPRPSAAKASTAGTTNDSSD